MGKRGPEGKYKKIYSTTKLQEYLDSCKDEHIKTVVQENPGKEYKMYKTTLKVHLPTIEGYAMYIGCTASTLYNWEKIYPEFASAKRRIVQIQKQVLIDRGLEGAYNPVIAKLILSNNHGMRETADITSGNKPLNTFNDDQINKIAERIARRQAGDGDTSGTEKSN